MLLLILQRYEFSSKSQRCIQSIFNKGSCCWYYKGTNFQANHNAASYGLPWGEVVADTTKVRIFKQITTTSFGNWFLQCCCWYYKGTNFQANHNDRLVTEKSPMLLLILQRYEFSSKSQLYFPLCGIRCGCCWYYKGTNFQANHNWKQRALQVFLVVADTTKVRIFKQITTTLRLIGKLLELLLILQRYEFSSKSQRTYVF